MNVHELQATIIIVLCLCNRLRVPESLTLAPSRSLPTHRAHVFQSSLFLDCNIVFVLLPTNTTQRAYLPIQCSRGGISPHAGG